MPCSPPENLDQEFDFYIRFVKPLVLNLPEANDRVKAAAWIQKLRSVTDDLNLRNEYLKLFLFALQRKRLVGPFADVPPDTLEAFPEGNGLTDMMKCLIELDAKEDRSGAQPPCTTEISSDLKEYAAVQKIPNYGVHCYLAISNEPLPKWERTDQVALPPGVMRPKDSTPDVSTLKTGVTWVDSLRRSPCKKSKSEAPCGTCKSPEPCKPVSSATSYRKPCPGAAKKSGRKKRFTDDELPGLGLRDPEALDMADALLCAPSLVKRELFLDDHDIFAKDRDRDDSYLHIIFEPSPGEKAVGVGGEEEEEEEDEEDVDDDDDDDDEDDEGESEFGYAGEEDEGEDADESEGGEEGEEEQGGMPRYDEVAEDGSGLYDSGPESGRFEMIGGYPVYKYPGMDLNFTPMSSGILNAPISRRDSRPPLIEQKEAFIGVPPEPFNKPYDPPFTVYPPSWMYPDAPHYRGNDEPIPTAELVHHIWQNQDDIQMFPWDITFVPDRPVEFHVQRAPFGPPEDASFSRFRLVPPRLADVPKEDRPQTLRLFHLYEECSPSQYEELLRQQEEEEGGGGGDEEETRYYDAYP